MNYEITIPYTSNMYKTRTGCHVFRGELGRAWSIVSTDTLFSELYWLAIKFLDRQVESGIANSEHDVVKEIIVTITDPEFKGNVEKRYPFIGEIPVGIITGARHFATPVETFFTLTFKNGEERVFHSKTTIDWLNMTRKEIFDRVKEFLTESFDKPLFDNSDVVKIVIKPSGPFHIREITPYSWERKYMYPSVEDNKWIPVGKTEEGFVLYFQNTKKMDVINIKETETIKKEVKPANCYKCYTPPNIYFDKTSTHTSIDIVCPKCRAKFIYPVGEVISPISFKYLDILRDNAVKRWNVMNKTGERVEF